MTWKFCSLKSLGILLPYKPTRIYWERQMVRCDPLNTLDGFPDFQFHCQERLPSYLCNTEPSLHECCINYWSGVGHMNAIRLDVPLETERVFYSLAELFYIYPWCAKHKSLACYCCRFMSVNEVDLGYHLFTALNNTTHYLRTLVVF